MKRLALLLFCLAACKTQTAAAPAPAANPQAAQGPAKSGAATAWKALVDASDRSEKDRALDPGRHAAEMLEFLDLKPGMKVADLGAAGGYTTELMARAVGPSGVVYMQNDPSWMPFLKDAIAERMTHTAAMKNVVRAEVPFGDAIPKEAKNLDEVVMNVIYHDIANMPVDRVRMNRLIFNALQPGGAYVVIDSSAKNGSGVSETATLHRIDEKVVKDEVEQAGFKLAAQGDFLRNPADTRDWNSSPGAAIKAGKRGQGDRFALKFVRPEGSAQQTVPPRLRLPEGVKPVRARAELTIDPTRDDFTGVEEIELTADAATPLLWLNAEELKILDTDPKSTVIDAQPGFVGLQFTQPLPSGASTVKLRWQGRLSRIDNQGAFRQQENGRWYALTQGEALGMRRILPCFDEPSFKIPWKISLRVRKADAAYFNTPVESTEDAGEEKVVHFAETRPLPSYLLAFGVGPFERVDAGKIKTGEPVGIVVTQGKTAWAKYSAQSSPRLMNILEDYFQVPYPYPKLDLIEVPLGGGAMENPGLITFGQRINLAKPGTDTPSFLRRAANVEAHEFAHLWFGDLVTTAWWDDLWLNEAFASWMTFKAIEQFAPSWGAPTERIVSMNHAMDADRLLSARRIRQPIDSEGDIKTAFDAITYQKGAAVIGMFEHWVGAQQFRKGVKRYLTGHADGNATAKDFLAAISAEGGKDLAPAFSTFLDQGGLPLVSMKLVCEGEKARLDLSQSRYLPLGTAGPSREQLWQIPICVRTSSGSACTLLAEKTGALALSACPQWVVPNVDGVGYYRSALDDDSAAKLTKNVAQLSVPERMLFFSDLDAAAHAGAIDVSRDFQLLLALANDKDRHVVEELSSPLRYVRSHGFLPGEALAKYGAFVREAFSKRAGALGFKEKKGEADDVRILRPTVLRVEGDEGGDLTLRAEAQKLALQWLADHKAASPELASAALHLSAIDADELLWEKLHSAAKAEPDRIERQRILGAMGAVRDPELAQKNFALFLTDEFDAREALPLASGAGDDPRTRETLWAFVQKSWDAIVARLPKDSPAFLPSLGAGFCDEEHAAALGQFFRPKAKDHAGMERKLAQAMEEVRQCAAFKAKQGPALLAFLKGR
jgi:alanyl aminopeptidase